MGSRLSSLYLTDKLIRGQNTSRWRFILIISAHKGRLRRGAGLWWRYLYGSHRGEDHRPSTQRQTPSHRRKMQTNPPMGSRGKGGSSKEFKLPPWLFVSPVFTSRWGAGVTSYVPNWKCERRVRHVGVSLPWVWEIRTDAVTRPNNRNGRPVAKACHRHLCIVIRAAPSCPVNARPAPPGPGDNPHPRDEQETRPTAHNEPCRLFDSSLMTALNRYHFRSLSARPTQWHPFIYFFCIYCILG